jgi:hypothetical protein
MIVLLNTNSKVARATKTEKVVVMLYRCFVCLIFLGCFAAFWFLTTVYAVLVSAGLMCVLAIGTLVTGACQVSREYALNDSLTYGTSMQDFVEDAK